MSPWEPTIGRWDDGSYDIKEPLWRQVLNRSVQYRSVDDVQKMIVHLNRWNLHGYTILIPIAGCRPRETCESLPEELGDLVSADMLSDMLRFARERTTLAEYTARVLRSNRVSDAIIEEFLENK